MAQKTEIQWSHGTVNPAAGCDGCPLLPTSARVQAVLLALLLRFFPQAKREDLTAFYIGLVGNMEGTQLWIHRKAILKSFQQRLGDPQGFSKEVLQAFQKLFKCYAAKLTAMRGGKVKGYARVFEHIEKFPGRMAIAAKWPDLLGQEVPDKPWLAGLPRLIFLSDMGDLLSTGIDFPYIKQEVVDVVVSAAGQRHLWLWLTKRPARMAKFGKWLADQGIAWPDNLVAMTSVINQRMADANIDHLRQVPAKMKGLSVEPLWEQVQLDLHGIDWVIVGGESGNDQAEVFDLAWARNLQEQCQAAGTAFFVKQLGRKPVEHGALIKLADKHGGDWNEWPADLRVREMPAGFYTYRSASATSSQS